MGELGEREIIVRETSFFIIRAIERFTNKVALDLAEVATQHKALTGEVPIVSIFVPSNLKGAVIVEGKKKFEILKLVKQVKQARGMMSGKVSFEEVMKLVDVPEDLLGEGELVEVIAGPFKGLDAQVVHDDGSKITAIILEWEVSNRISLSKSQIRRKRE